MKVFSTLADPAVAGLIRQGAIGVMPTDTLYGIVAAARNAAAVERLYEVRQRDAGKACIVLIGEREQLDDVAAWSPADWHAVAYYWPGPFSMILPVTKRTPGYLTRGGQTLAYRLPQNPDLQEFLRRTGPLLAPSANLQGKQPATTLAEAQSYFGDRVDFYVDGGQLQGRPSTLIKAEAGKLRVLRQGAGRVDGQDLA